MYPEEIILFIFDILIFFCAFHEFVLVCLCHDARNLFYIFFHYLFQYWQIMSGYYIFLTIYYFLVTHWLFKTVDVGNITQNVL